MGIRHGGACLGTGTSQDVRGLNKEKTAIKIGMHAPRLRATRVHAKAAACARDNVTSRSSSRGVPNQILPPPGAALVRALTEPTVPQRRHELDQVPRHPQPAATLIRIGVSVPTNIGLKRA